VSSPTGGTRAAPDPHKYTTIAHGALAVCNPVGDALLDGVLERLPLPAPPGRRPLVLDAGCGKAELLLRLIERRGVKGVGVDSNAAFIEEARAQARRRVRRGALELHAGSVREFLAARAAPVPGKRAPPRFDAALCTGAAHAFGTAEDALVALRDLVRPGGTLLFGDGYWKRPPEPSYLEAIGAAGGELLEHAGNIARAEALGLTLVEAAVASDEDLDRYETAHAAALARYIAGQPHDPDAPAIARRANAWRAAYLHWGRGTMGFALYVFRTPGTEHTTRRI
jgi:SAM-dependent methyltransferase